jgi:hypothetical protein
VSGIANENRKSGRLPVQAVAVVTGRHGQLIKIGEQGTGNWMGLHVDSVLFSPS